MAPRSPLLDAPGRQRPAHARGDLRARVERAADPLAVALDGVVGDRYEGHRRCSSPITGDSGSSATRADRQQHAGHEARAVGRHVADRQRLGDVAEDDLLVGDEPGQAHGVDRHVALHHLGGARGGARRRVELAGWCSSMISARSMMLRRLGGEAHHQHGADREVRARRTRSPRRRGRLAQPVLVEAGGPDHDVHAGGERLARVAERLVGLREVDEHVGVAEHVGDRGAERGVGAAGQLHVLGALDGARRRSAPCGRRRRPRRRGSISGGHLGGRGHLRDGGAERVLVGADAGRATAARAPTARRSARAGRRASRRRCAP